MASHHTDHFIWLSKVSWMVPTYAKGLGFSSTLIKREILIRFHTINFTVWICRQWSDQSLNDVICVRSMQLPHKKMTRERNIFGRIGFMRGLMWQKKKKRLPSIPLIFDFRWCNDDTLWFFIRIQLDLCRPLIVPPEHKLIFFINSCNLS